MIQHHINTENAKPVKQAPRRLPFHHLKEVKKLVESMLDNNVIEPSNGPWASPIVLVKKKDGSTRFCVDFRQLNSGHQEGRTSHSQGLTRLWMHCMEHVGFQHLTWPAATGR